MRGQVTGMSHSDSHPRLWMTSGRSVLAKFARMTWHSKWMPCLEKFFKNALWASSSRNRRWEGVGLEDENALEWRRFRDGVDLNFGAIDTTNVNKRERGKKETVKRVPNSSNIASILKKEYVCMGRYEHVTCKRNYMKFLRLNLQNPSQNYTKTSLILKKTQNFAKIPKT